MAPIRQNYAKSCAFFLPLLSAKFKNEANLDANDFDRESEDGTGTCVSVCMQGMFVWASSIEKRTVSKWKKKQRPDGKDWKNHF